MNNTIKALVEEISKVKCWVDECWVEGDYVGYAMLAILLRQLILTCKLLERLEAQLDSAQ
jgi:hypothetical protein